jgi:hypothetical protein
MSQSPSLPQAKLQSPEWQLPYQEALFEFDPAKLPERVSAAESVLLKRLATISQNQNSLSPDLLRERHKIEDALSNLRLLMRVSKAA